MQFKRFAVVVALIAVALPSFALAAKEEFDWSGSVAPGQTVEIKGVNGDIVAEPVAGGAVDVHAVKSSRRDDPGEVTIEIIEHAGGVTVCAVYPGKNNNCEPGPNGNLGAKDNDVTVSFTIGVPAGVNFVGQTVNGSIEIKDLDAGARANTVNGNVNLSVDGAAQANTVNGSIRASMGRADWDGELAFNTVNGSITIDLPSDASADISVKTLNGSISTDFPITVSGKFTGKSARGTIGSGGRDLSVETVNGSVKLRNKG
ncbi:MAG: DUF4097 family beta strand repeat-containing protein [Acidobacteriota bacterium]|nr:DUF4097 family beta strand repeat-containing protein [Acidobacteriota bacterium]